MKVIEHIDIELKVSYYYRRKVIEEEAFEKITDDPSAFYKYASKFKTDKNRIGALKDGDSFFSFVDELYENEKKYPYLTKVFDAEDEGYEKLRVKIFSIDYDVFKSGK